MIHTGITQLLVVGYNLAKNRQNLCNKGFADFYYGGKKSVGLLSLEGKGFLCTRNGKRALKKWFLLSFQRTLGASFFMKVGILIAKRFCRFYNIVKDSQSQ